MSQWKRADHVAESPHPQYLNCTFVLSPTQTVPLALHGSALDIWKALGPLPVNSDAIVEEVAWGYDVDPDTIRNAVEEFLSELCRYNLAECVKA